MILHSLKKKINETERNLTKPGPNDPKFRPSYEMSQVQQKRDLEQLKKDFKENFLKLLEVYLVAGTDLLSLDEVKGRGAYVQDHCYIAKEASKYIKPKLALNKSMQSNHVLTLVGVVQEVARELGITVPYVPSFRSEHLMLGFDTEGQLTAVLEKFIEDEYKNKTQQEGHTLQIELVAKRVTDLGILKSSDDDRPVLLVAVPHLSASLVAGYHTKFNKNVKTFSLNQNIEGADEYVETVLELSERVYGPKPKVGRPPKNK